MLNDILEAIRCKVEEIELAGHTLTVREMPEAASLGYTSTAEAVADQDGSFYRMAVRCVFFKETGLPVFEDSDIPAIREASKRRLAKLLAAVTRVNGLDGDDNAKK